MAARSRASSAQTPSARQRMRRLFPATRASVGLRFDGKCVIDRMRVFHFIFNLLKCFQEIDFKRDTLQATVYWKNPENQY
ncbi:hypothetical protein ATB98_06470 [Sinorhizobium saheli]|uniref:Uncharacterized protein n=1 Tax=Sinorhizobium saheli TaxID=36856 RepID=A0A178Y396_SINSA|nr:hypothetical protein ATB98_06470 [Sinorhizobium saheli]